MTSAAEPAGAARADLRTVLVSGAKLALLTTLGVTAFALLSRATSGTVETLVRSLLVLAGGAAFSFLPAAWVRPRDVDSIAWAALVGLLAALGFTVLDTAILRPLDLYHWSWDELGGGSGFWYIPVWWMGSATLAWLGSWTYSVAAGKGEANVLSLAGATIGFALAAFVVLGLLGAGFSSPVMALAFTVALIVGLVFASVVKKP